jgi:hypothetical protein
MAGAAVFALAAGAAQAATHHQRTSGKTAGVYSEPSQPVAYSKLDSYLKASSHARTRQSWGLDNTGMAAGAAGSAANASATAPQNDVTQPSGGAAPADQGAAAPAPSTEAPNPPATAPQAAPDTSAQPPATSTPK